MISENKNKWGSGNALLPRKSRLKATPVVEQTRLPDGQGSLRGKKKSKILVLGLALIIVLVGIFGSVKKAQAVS